MNVPPSQMLELPRPGDVVGGKYRIEAIIGTGGMGVVMGAADLSLGRAVAIKFLSPQKLASEGARERFVREARAAASLQSENVVRVYEIGALPNGAPYIVMEHLHGAELASVLKVRSAIRIDEAVDWMLQACEAIAEAHARGIVHRDLKPQNLFLTSRADGSASIKVLDFGISKAASGEHMNLTSTDMVMGTPLYMSPEQVRSLKNVDHRADIWALGAIVFELLTGAPVFEAPTMSALCVMIANDPPPPLRLRRPDAPLELEQVILRCLQKDPADRFQDVAAFAEALAPFASPRGRESALRVSRVARATTAAPNVIVAGGARWSSPTLMEATATDESLRSSSGPIPPTTQQGWDRLPSVPAPAVTVADKRASDVVTIAGVLIILLVAGGGAAAWLLRPRAAAAPAPIVASSAPTPAPTPSAEPPPMTLPPPEPPPPATTATSDTARDAGTRRKTKDAGVYDDTYVHIVELTQEQCKGYRRDMTVRAHNEAERKRAAERAKLFACRGMASTRCEREVCMQACNVLGDTRCTREMQFVIEHGPEPLY